ncbi:TadE/TadG family type IV pilus assembly protein [Paractinoplanes lichenicola]|uniref:Tad domain-containing protein n=1 Tax=Paractinoplanes lichenicola TaxID=2802976 RepID=A0ABS1W621_9ACTN|nr:Tad domain-containing protein [Actinoplanes lichenicola]MBL7262184.1 Tad domain-containing protein [Actinoplanes lichenicola]
MHRLTRRPLLTARRVWRRALRRHGSENGVVAAMLAVLLSTGVFFGTGALVIDVAQLSLERTELQSSADAASWAVAMRCVRNAADCTMAAQSTVAQTYTTKNIKRGSADSQICLTGVTGQTCSTWSSTTACPATTVTGGKSVEVRTSTKLSSGSTLLPPTFAGTLSGTTYTGTRVGACGRVAWGPPAISKVFALGISLCDWQRMTNNGSTYYGPLVGLLGQLGLFPFLGLPAPTAAAESAIAQVLPAAVLGLPLPSCTTPTVNLSKPRGWTWLYDNSLNPPDANCELSLNIGDEPRGFVLSGLAAGAACRNRLQTLYTTRQPILVPIFDQIEQTLLSLAPTYRIAGFAPFVVTGYDTLIPGVLQSVANLLSPGGVPSLLEKALCTISSCIYGYFTRTVVPIDNPVFGTGSDFGATVIGRTG